MNAMAKSSENREAPNSTSRRDVLKATALAVGAAGIGSAVGGGAARAATNAKGLPLAMAGYKFERVAALVDGKVTVEGADTTFEVAGIGDMNTDVFGGRQKRDVTEIGLHPFMLAYSNEGFRDYTLLPIFPLRLFRHKSVFIRTDRGIKTPEDLRGRSIGTPSYSSTSLTWLRGIFQDEYGISPQDVEWVTSSKDSSAEMAGKVSKQESMAPEGVPISAGPAGMDESDLLVSGKVDALFHAAEPRAFIEGHPKVARLFPDSRTVERKYYVKTGIFPIMHAVAIKKAVLEENPWLSAAIFKAYSQAKQMSYEHMAKAAWVYDMLPWYGQEFEETQALMGDNFYSYGIKSNRKTLEALFRYSHQQGLANRELTIEELFDPGGLELTEETA
jgi:4,5-dihydroxyphthalate decarboxylase